MVVWPAALAPRLLGALGAVGGPSFTTAMIRRSSHTESVALLPAVRLVSTTRMYTSPLTVLGMLPR
ncbi:hypothetical protein D3C83_66320 [compost metagenome]